MGKNTKFTKARFYSCDNRKFYLGGNRRTVAAILNANPFIGDKPDERISLCVYADERGLRYWNNKKDSIPFKTINNNGLKIWEETEDYIIYIDKDAITTTVEKYVVGSYQTFMERMKDIEESNELIKSYNIEWTSEDSSNLFIQINNEALEKLEQSAMLLSEDTISIVLDPKTVPTSYECCFTIRKDDNFSFYINNGYENLFPLEQFYDYGNGSYFKSLKNPTYPYNVLKLITTTPDLKYYINYKEVENVGINPMKVHMNISALQTLIIQPSNKIFDYGGAVTTVSQAHLQVRFDALEINTEIKFNIKKPIIVKSDIQKPFIKSIQPNCKIYFTTPATCHSHSFIMKGIISHTNGNVVRPLSFIDELYGISGNLEYNNIYFANNRRNTSFIASNESKIILTDDGEFTLNQTINTTGKPSIMVGLNVQESNRRIETFKCLLIYGANFTKDELKAEFIKNIRLK